MISYRFFKKPYIKYTSEKLVNDNFLNVSYIFLWSGITIAIFQIYGIISYFIYFSNNLFIALLNLSFDEEYFDILGCISSGPKILQTFCSYF